MKKNGSYNIACLGCIVNGTCI